MAPIDILVLVPITLLFVTCFFVGRRLVAKRKVVCPRTGEQARVHLVQSTKRPCKFESVRRCDLLPDPEKVDCGQGCLKQFA